MSNELTINQKIDNFKVQIMSSYNKELTNFFMNNEKEKLKFMSGIVYSISKVPKLLECSPDSLMNSVLELAQIGLTPGISGEVYILPYKGKATAIIGYQGYVTLSYKAGISSIYAEIVRKNDNFKNILGSEPKILHEVDPNKTLKDRGEAIGVYVVVKVNGEKIHKYMNKEEIMKFKEFSTSKGTDTSPRHEKNDPELNMWKKTVFKQVLKYLPKNEQINRAIEIDNIEAPVNGKKDVVVGGSEDLAQLGNIFKNLESNKSPNESK